MHRAVDRNVDRAAALIGRLKRDAVRNGRRI